ncbi:MAG: cyclase family protein [Clostridia bacterium]|nr:cyclase family protein [Clostridia bacterium]
MKLYDISQEVFGCAVYPGDPTPKKESLSRMEIGDLYNLTAFSMCAHNGTHVDAPYHFIEDGKTVEQIPLEKTVGLCFVAEWQGILDEENARQILRRAALAVRESARRILLKGNVTVSAAAARVFAEGGVDLIGNESQTVGPEDVPMEVHKILLGADVVLLEGIRLSDVPEGVYFLSAAPLCLGGADGAPCRDILAEWPLG